MPAIATTEQPLPFAGAPSTPESQQQGIEPPSPLVVTTTHPDVSAYITMGVDRRVLSLATGLERGEQRIDHLAWILHRLKQGKGISLITQTDAERDLGMKHKQWLALRKWLITQRWIAEYPGQPSSSIWSYGTRVAETDWKALRLQAQSEDRMQRADRTRRQVLKRVEALRKEANACVAASETVATRMASSNAMLDTSGIPSTDVVDLRAERAIPSVEMLGVIVERNQEFGYELGVIHQADGAMAVIEIIDATDGQMKWSGASCSITDEWGWCGWSIAVDQEGEAVTYSRLVHDPALLSSLVSSSIHPAGKLHLLGVDSCDSMLPGPGSTVTIDKLPGEYIVVTSDWGDSPDSDIIRCHPVGKTGDIIAIKASSLLSVVK